MSLAPDQIVIYSRTVIFANSLMITVVLLTGFLFLIITRGLKQESVDRYELNCRKVFCMLHKVNSETSNQMCYSLELYKISSYLQVHRQRLLTKPTPTVTIYARKEVTANMFQANDDYERFYLNENKLFFKGFAPCPGIIYIFFFPFSDVGQCDRFKFRS